MERGAHLKEGKWGEEVAKEFLVGQGYALLEQNWRMGHLEVDLIMQKGQQIVFIEVKTRQSEKSDPVSAVHTRKRSRMISAADQYMQRFNLPLEYRFDIIAITGAPNDYQIQHLPDAFFPSVKNINYSFRL